MPDGSIRLHQGKTPMPSGGTFADNGYALDKPSPVTSYVMRPVPNRPNLGASVAEYEKFLLEKLTGQKQLTAAERKQQAGLQKYEKYKAEQDAQLLEAKKYGLYAILGLGGVAMTGLILFMIHKTRVAARP
jgi:hypothetical protein